MKPDNYTSMSVARLIDRFIEEANRVGTIVRIERTKVPLDGPEWQEANAVLGALTHELIRRDAVAAVRARLFENPSPDVRGWAGMKWSNSDPIWAYAAFMGVLKHMSTQQVLAWRDRVLRGPPKRPTLKEMTTTQLLNRFVDACERCYGSTRFLLDEDGNNVSMAAYNEVSGEPFGVAKELHLRGELGALIPFLDHPFVTVRQKAANCCLKIATEKALTVLEALCREHKGKEGHEACSVLTLWRLGKFPSLS